MTQKEKIKRLVKAGNYEAAAYHKGSYERRNATYLRTYEFLNQYRSYQKALEGRVKLELK